MLRTPKGDKKTPKKKTRGKSEEKSDAQKSEKQVKVVPVTPISKQLEEQRRKEKARKMEEQLKVLIRQRDAVAEKLDRVKVVIKSSTEQPNQNLKNLHFLKLQLKTVEACYGEFNAFQNQIYGLALTPEQEKQHRACYLKFETLHNILTIQLNELIERLSKPSVALVPAAPACAVVPQYLPPLSVPLPKFDGTYENWFSFKCMFRSVMDRYQGEAPSMKLYHLRNSLVGRAEGVIDQDIINNNDYEAAWALLVETYEDKRVIIDKHIQALFSLPKITHDKADEFRKLIDTCVKHIGALKHLQLPVNGLSEQMLVNLLAARMDRETRKAWESEQTAGELPTYEATMEFLKKSCRVLEQLELTSVSANTAKPHRSVALLIAGAKKCSTCNRQHDLKGCDQFKTKSVNEKYSHLRKCGLCFNCLKKGHRVAVCTSTNTCMICGKRHHTMLHTDGVKKQMDASMSMAPASPKANDEHRARPARKQTLLSTAVVLVDGGSGGPHLCRALIDSGSQNHFVTERFADKLAIKKMHADYQVSGLHDSKTRTSSLVRAMVRSRVGDFSTELELLVTPSIIDELPPESIDITSWNIPPNIKLADPGFNSAGQIDMLLGAELFWNLIKSGRITLAENLPSLRETELGWVVGGALKHAAEERN
ncbi:uncharacterized protein LOC120432417 [Culex pipiens pallens]|uniref:uncharacterized protein LOC120432417 n=1 Tax=Culex pipiens pallens TaxID=42434 RepID=UPI00195429C0|nr:uncharacterized protein LOC120432417 [Culex pipiens pallens]